MYLPAIVGYVPSEMVKAVSALIDFIYLVRRNVIDETAVAQIQNTLDRFYHHREIFREVGICPDGFSLPRQHSLRHYIFSITQFGAPNGLCSSITESKHIKEVKKTYRRSSRNKPLGQMLITTQRINKITAARVDFNARGMLNGPSPAIDIFSGLPSGHANHDQHSDEHSLEHNTDLAALDDRERHDSRPKDNPKANAEITLAKTYGACVFFHIFAPVLSFCLHSAKPTTQYLSTCTEDRPT